MKKYKAISFAILVLLIATLALSCTSKANTAAAAGQTATVQSGNLSVDILASGNLVTSNEANLAFYSAGTVQDVLVKIGDNVTAGQALAKLDTAPLESNLAQAEINVETAQMNLENAEEPQTDSSGTVISAPDPLNIDIKQLQLQNAQANQAEAQKDIGQGHHYRSLRRARDQCKCRAGRPGSRQLRRRARHRPGEFSGQWYWLVRCKYTI